MHKEPPHCFQLHRNSCLGLFIESGFDIINPVQISAKGMDLLFLKKEFGKDITFWGGGVDTQRILPFGTPVENIAAMFETLHETS